MKVLVTGFGPFDRFGTNPTEELVRSLAASGDHIRCLVLPVVYGKASEVLMTQLKDQRPDLTVSFGLNPTIGHIALEELAVNLRASEVPDNSGRTASEEPIDPKGPLALRSLLPLRRMMTRLREEGIPCKLSYSAGVYLCNEVFYTLTRWCIEKGRLGGFVHIPLSSELVASDRTLSGSSSLPAGTLLKAGKLILEEAESSIR
jgi:pyroglutamyl-peptidase